MATAITKLSTRDSRPRVALDVHTLGSLYQGSRTYCFEIFSRLIRLVPEIDFFLFVETARWDSKSRQAFSGSNVTTVHMPHASQVRRLAFQLPGLARKHRIDILHTQYICPIFLSAKAAVSIHDILFEDFPQYFGTVVRLRSKLFFRLAARRSDLLFTVSDFSRQALASRYRVPIHKIVKTSNGVDANHFAPGLEGQAQVESLGIKPGEYLLTVGRLEPRKNHIGLLKALSLLPHPRPRLVIVGQEDFGYETIYQAVEDLDLTQDTLFVKSADAALLAALYRHARIFVYPTFAEGFGIPVLEAMASGVPVITSNTTSLPEVAGSAALLINPASPHSIYQAITSVLADRNLAERMITQGHDQAASFSWDDSAKAMAQAYRRYFRLKAD